MPRIFNTSGSRLSQVTQRPSAHLTLRDTNSQGEAPGGWVREGGVAVAVHAALRVWDGDSGIKEA